MAAHLLGMDAAVFALRNHDQPNWHTGSEHLHDEVICYKGAHIYKI